MASTSMPFSWAMASRLPMNSMCAVPMFVMMATSGFAIAARGWISPGWFMPISSTAISSAALARSSMRGTPMWLLKLPSVFSTRNRRLKTAAVKSFVLVLPLLPVIATTRKGSRLR